LLNVIAMRIVGLGQNLEYANIGFIAPVAMGSMLIIILLDTQLAFISAVVFSLLAGFIFNERQEVLFDFRFGLVTLAVSYAAIFALQKAGQRAAILKAGIFASI